MALSQTVCFACLAIFSLGSESPAPAVEKSHEPLRSSQKTSAPRVKKDQFRYAGKSFSYWRKRLLTELEPKERLRAFQALKEFAQHGFAAECAAAFLETARWSPAIRELLETEWTWIDFQSKYRNKGSWVDLENRLDNENLVFACIEAAAEIGGPAVPVFRKGLRDDSRSIRLCAIASLGLMAGKGCEAALPDLLKIIKGKDLMLRIWAFAAVNQIDVKDKEVSTVLLEALAAGNNKEDRLAVLKVLGNSDSSLVKMAGPVVLKALLDLAAGDTKEDRLAALQALVNLDPSLVKTAEPTLLKALADPDSDVRQAAYSWLKKWGTEVEWATTALLTRLKQLPADAGRTKDYQYRTIRHEDGHVSRIGYPPYDELADLVATFGAIGSKAKEAIPVLKDLVKQADRKHLEQIEEAIKKINE
jgi:HEAT repeat protein